jgi:hypothetical protein
MAIMISNNGTKDVVYTKRTTRYFRPNYHRTLHADRGVFPSYVSRNSMSSCFRT